MHHYLFILSSNFGEVPIRRGMVRGYQNFSMPLQFPVSSQKFWFSVEIHCPFIIIIINKDLHYYLSVFKDFF